jgi:Protein of unknown function (DUF4446)
VGNLGSTAGTAALIAGGLSVLALLLSALLFVKFNRLRSDQRAVLGDEAPRDVVEYAREIQQEIGRLSSRVDDLAERADATAGRLDGAITHSAVVRYDAYNEMSGRQSSSIALLDEHRNGVVLSSILHREQARLYAKGVTAGRPEIDLSPEEQAAVDAALTPR